MSNLDKEIADALAKVERLKEKLHSSPALRSATGSQSRERSGPPSITSPARPRPA